MQKASKYIELFSFLVNSARAGARMRKNKFSQKIMHTKSKINAVQSFHDIFGARTFWRALSISDLKSLINVDTFCTFNHWDYSKTHETRSIWRFFKNPFLFKIFEKNWLFQAFFMFFWAPFLSFRRDCLLFWDFIFPFSSFSERPPKKYH